MLLAFICFMDRREYSLSREVMVIMPAMIEVVKVSLVFGLEGKKEDGEDSFPQTAPLIIPVDQNLKWADR